MSWAVMVEGKLVWHQQHPCAHQKGWYTWSIDDNVLYLAVPIKEQPRGWLVTASEYRGPRLSLGTTRKLVDAKRLADAHHHRHIEKNSPEHVVNYIRRYPIGAQ